MPVKDPGCLERIDGYTLSFCEILGGVALSMDVNRNGLKIDGSNNGAHTLESPKIAMIEENDGDDESKALLLSDDGGLPKKTEKPKRKVQWLDRNGDKLAEILEFQPSDVSDSEEEDSDSCICRIM